MVLLHSCVGVGLCVWFWVLFSGLGAVFGLGLGFGLAGFVGFGGFGSGFRFWFVLGCDARFGFWGGAAWLFSGFGSGLRFLVGLV